MPTVHKKKPNINLVIKSEPEVSFSGQLLAWAFTYGRYIIIITQIIVLSVFFLRFRLDRDHTDLKESVTQKQALIESVADLETEIKRVQQRLSNIHQISVNQDGLIKIIRFLQNSTPTDTTYTNLSITSESISFTATSKNLRSFSYFLRRLQVDNKLTEVTIDDIVRRNDGRIEFKIQAKVNLKAFT